MPGPDEIEEASPSSTRRNAGRAYRAYAWWNRYGWFRWLSSLFPGVTDMTLAVGSVTIVAGVAAATITDAIDSRAKRAAERNWARVRHEVNSTVYAISGADTWGRRVAFDVVVLDKAFEWAHASSTSLNSSSGSVLEGPAVGRTVFGDKVREEIAAAPQIITVGTASQEGDAATELRRADQRARQAAAWIAPLAEPSAPIWTLNLGQYSQPCTRCETRDTSWQRPFIVVTARPLVAGADLREALSNAMSGRSNLPSPAAYSAFELTRFR